MIGLRMQPRFRLVGCVFFGALRKKKNPLPLIKRDLGAPVVEGARDVDVSPSSCPADHGRTLLRARLHQVVQIRGQILLYRSLRGKADRTPGY